MSSIQVTHVPLRGEALNQARPMLTALERHELTHKELQGFAALYDGKTVGILLFRAQDRRMVMERIFVDPRFRLLGIGRELLQAACLLADAQQLTFLFSFDGTGHRDGFYRFVASARRFLIQRQPGCTALVTAEDVRQLCRKYPRGHTEPTLFFDLNHITREEFLAHLHNEYPDIAYELRTHHWGYREDLCCCITGKHGVEAACFMKEDGDGLELKLLYARPGEGVLAARALLQTIGELGRCEPAPVRFTPVGDAAMGIMEKLCPGHCIEKYVYTAYYIKP